MINVFIVLFLLLIAAAFIWSLLCLSKKSQKDWKILEDLKQKANNVKTIEEVALLHAELVEKGNKIYNKYIHIELSRIDGYLRGMYKFLKTNNDGKEKINS